MSFRFRPCIDLHEGKVKQIVGGSLRDDGSAPRENFVSEKPPEWFSGKFRDDGLTGGHVIMLGKGNDEAAKAALSGWPGGMQVGGGIRAENAKQWLDTGASHVIVTSALFDAQGKFLQQALDEIVAAVGKEKLVIDLSCRRTATGWTVAMNRWQTLTDLDLTHESLDCLLPFCDEFLIHAADVEGLCGGIDEPLVRMLGEWGKCPITYAGGAASMADVELVAEAGQGRVDVTVGSALDLFGGSGICYEEMVAMSGI
ncbi:MAG: phosphoribosylformimino-5-aminoimidazole carboxamide ribotide isomerase [Akkermansiaceae bacterium]|nr:phosphoribosylformimino-5-aminoimidazole carboxamide ribotide isomerase [Akkermansiaceae bacterium]MDP4647220.1 phosphoribosylformimino-5-aminoimidazole carboxamide ribotide isomerase [Akkermansiaceae bacterium]MDP4721682.1 phosphoribosylformimino-5-aminoimidazole carboxamide ribotide isomerase [Akkermansiaceae bacterium]MDP4780902.1 phosphoribosylformimino-5-aminoimidazole carboxamide ribotide isomerase [Akkermansiaceae bacterium]MDP4846548.1 phosphoribosylformimino-5-aminoimidazole carboxa